jgi:hypothetical protein
VILLDKITKRIQTADERATLKAIMEILRAGEKCLESGLEEDIEAALVLNTQAAFLILKLPAPAPENQMLRDDVSKKMLAVGMDLKDKTIALLARYPE